MPGKMARSDPRLSVEVTRGAGSGQHLASVLQEGRENANIGASLGFIWRISVIIVCCENLNLFFGSCDLFGPRGLNCPAMITPQWRRLRNEYRVHLRESQVERATVNGHDIEQDKACIVHKSGNLGKFRLNPIFALHRRVSGIGPPRSARLGRTDTFERLIGFVFNSSHVILSNCSHGFAFADVLAFMSFPKDHRPKIHSIIRSNGSMARSSAVTDVVGTFPNEDAIEYAFSGYSSYKEQCDRMAFGGFSARRSGERTTV